MPVEVANVRTFKSLGDLNWRFMIIRNIELAHRVSEAHLNSIPCLVELFIDDDYAFITQKPDLILRETMSTSSGYQNEGLSAQQMALWTFDHDRDD